MFQRHWAAFGSQAAYPALSCKNLGPRFITNMKTSSNCTYGFFAEELNSGYLKGLGPIQSQHVYSFCKPKCISLTYCCRSYGVTYRPIVYLLNTYEYSSMERRGKPRGSGGLTSEEGSARTRYPWKCCS